MESFIRRLLINSIIAHCAICIGVGYAQAEEVAENRPVVLAPAGIQPAFEAIDRTQGLPSTSILEIKSDRHGFVWIAGDRGVHRFDGHNFFNIDRDPGQSDTLESRFVYLLAEASDAMWIGSPNGALQRLDARTGKLTRFPVQVGNASPKGVLRIECDALGQVWQMSDLGLVRLGRRGDVTWVMPRSFDAMMLHPDGKHLLVALPDRRVEMIDIRDPKRRSTLLTLPERTRGAIEAMVSDETGLWLAIDRELWRFEWKTSALRRIDMPVPLVRATSMVLAPDGALWLGSVFDEGLQRFDPAQGTLSVYRNDPDDPQSLRPGSVTALAVDRANNLWVGLGSAGISRLNLGQTALTRYRPKAGKNVCAMAELEDRSLVTTLCGGGLMVLNRQTGQLEPMPAASFLPRSSRALASDKNGGLWITSVREGLFHWRSDGSVRRFSLQEKGNNLPTPTMTDALLDDRQRLWVGHLGGLAVLEPGASELREVDAYDGKQLFEFDLIHDISQGRDGSLWVGTMTGLVNFNPETRQVRRYAYVPGDSSALSDNYVLQTHTDRQGRLWAATRAGLNRLTFDGKGRPVFRRYGLGDGLPDITIEAIVNDAQGALWVGTGNGIARWDPKRDRFQSYLPSDGIPNTDINMKSALLGADGGLYFGTLTGMWRIDPQALKIADPVPVVLSSYEAGDRTMVNLQGDALSGIQAKYADGRMVFRIAVLGDARRLSYRMEGLEDSWRNMPSDFTITYHWLPSGTYRLQVRQLQPDGRWGDPQLSLPIEIMPPWWRTVWAYLLYSLFVIALLIVSARAFMAWRHRALSEQLKESHARLSVALHAARFGMWGWDVDTNETELDSYARKLLAVPTDMRPMADVFSRMHPNDAERVREQVDHALQDNVAVDFEFRLPDTDADSGMGWRWVEGHATPYPRPGKTAYVIGVSRDATQRKRERLELEQSKQAAEHALEELTRSRLDLAMALESGDLGVWRSERAYGAAISEGMWTRGFTIDCDANVRRIVGWPVDRDITRGDFLRAVHPDDRRRVLERLLRALTESGNYADQYRIVHPNGEVRCIAVLAASIRNADHPAAGASLTGIVRDVTGEEALKAGLQQAAEEARLATEAKGRFLAMMSHEIRTPINGVVGVIDLLFKTPMDEEQQQLLGICKDSAQVLLTIINDILDFSKIEAGKLKLEHASLSPRRLVESVAESLHTEVARRGIDLDVFIASEVPRRLLGDRVRLHQVLANLIGNAVKFTEKGGVRVYVSVDGMSAGNLHRVRFDIVDTGIGMDHRTLDSLFQPFEQAEATTTRRFGGTGLGLTIVKHLVTLMEGEIECDSMVASGSRFSVIIPLESIAHRGAAKDHAVAGAKVLALCESTERASLLRELCSDLHVNIETAASPAALLQRLDHMQGTAAERTLVLIDKGFAEDHEALCRAIRATAAQLPIVLVRKEGPRATSPFVQGVATVAGSPLTSPGLARGFQLALGLASPELPTPAVESSADIPIRSEIAAEAEILVADDNATNREVITRQLRRLGYACDAVEDGEQAWERLQAERGRYRLLLTDCHMPKLDGYGLAERIRQEESASGRPRLPIVAITANALLGEGERCLACGMDAFLAKPMQMPDLERILARMLPRATGTETKTTGSSQEVEAEFDALARLVGNDETKLHRLLDIFVTSTGADLEQWRLARSAADGNALRYLAHKLKSGCIQLGERSAASAFEAVEFHSGTAADLRVLAASAQHELELTLARVAAFKERSLAEGR